MRYLAEAWATLHPASGQWQRQTQALQAQARAKMGRGNRFVRRQVGGQENGGARPVGQQIGIGINGQTGRAIQIGQRTQRRQIQPGQPQRGASAACQPAPICAISADASPVPAAAGQCCTGHGGRAPVARA